jgi:phage recombination protein Bet
MNEIDLFQPKNIEIIKNMYFRGLDNDNLQIFLHACKRTKLDPFMRQIYAVMRKNYKTNTEDMTIQTGIDGYRLIAERTGKYSPGREPTYSYNGEGKIISATAFVKKMTDDGTWHEVAATAFFEEYCQMTKEYQGKPSQPTQFWLKMGHTMIAKCAEALALRKAFPNDLSGIYTKEEMEQADCEISDCGDSDNSVAKLQIEQLKQDQEKQDYEELQNFLAQYPEELPDNIETFFGVMKDHWKQSLGYVLSKYRDHEKFVRDFGKWKSKNVKVSS